MSALDHEHLDAQMDAQSGTRIHMHRDTRVSGAVLEASQCCFVIESSLLWQIHCLLTLSLSLFLSLARSVFPMFFCSFSPSLIWMSRWPISTCCVERVSHPVALAASVLPQPLLQLSVASAAFLMARSQLLWRVQWTGEKAWWIRKRSGNTTSLKRFGNKSAPPY